VNEKTNGKRILVILCCLFVFTFVACKSAPATPVETPKTDVIIADLNTAQTDVAKEAQGASDSAEVIKETVKEIADAKTISDVQIKTLTVYTEKESGQRKILSDKIDEVTGLLNEATKSHIQDNIDNGKKLSDEKTARIKAESARDFWKSVAFKLGIFSGIMLLGIAGYFIVKLKIGI